MHLHHDGATPKRRERAAIPEVPNNSYLDDGALSLTMADELLLSLPTTTKLSWGGLPNPQHNEERLMTKVLAVVMIIASLLLVAPVIESGTTGATQFFQAIGTADGGAG